MGLTKKYVKSKKVYKVTFTVPESLTYGTDYVAIAGDFNKWDFNSAEMKKLKDGSFEKTLELKPGQAYQFRYVAAGGRWFNDEAADAYYFESFAGTDNSVVELPVVEEMVSVPKKATTTKKAASVVKKGASPKAKTVAKKTVTAKATATKATTTKVKATKTKATTKTAPVKAAATKSSNGKGTKHDLKKIEGVGPKIAQILAKNGIATFDTLAKTQVSAIEDMLKNAGPRYTMHKPATWPKQASLAAAGKWDDLKKLQDQLNGGK